MIRTETGNNLLAHLIDTIKNSKSINNLRIKGDSSNDKLFLKQEIIRSIASLENLKVLSISNLQLEYCDEFLTLLDQLNYCKKLEELYFEDLRLKYDKKTLISKSLI